MNQIGARITLLTTVIRADYKKEQARRESSGNPYQWSRFAKWVSLLIFMLTALCLVVLHLPVLDPLPCSLTHTAISPHTGS